MLGFSTQHPTVSYGTERPHLPPLGPAGVTNPPLGWPIVTKPRFRPSVSTAKSRYFNNLRLPYQTHTPYVFPSPSDSRRSLSSNIPLWRAVRRRAGIEDVRLHDLRHTFASHAVLRGIPLPVVSRLLGHKRPSMTLRYAHVGNREIEAAAERIGVAIARVLGGREASSSD